MIAAWFVVMLYATGEIEDVTTEDGKNAAAVALRANLPPRSLPNSQEPGFRYGSTRPGPGR